MERGMYLAPCHAYCCVYSSFVNVYYLACEERKCDFHKVSEIKNHERNSERKSTFTAHNSMVNFSVHFKSRTWSTWV